MFGQAHITILYNNSSTVKAHIFVGNKTLFLFKQNTIHWLYFLHIVIPKIYSISTQYLLIQWLPVRHEFNFVDLNCQRKKEN